jgi:hypothetical protein
MDRVAAGSRIIGWTGEDAAERPAGCGGATAGRSAGQGRRSCTSIASTTTNARTESETASACGHCCSTRAGGAGSEARGTRAQSASAGTSRCWGTRCTGGETPCTGTGAATKSTCDCYRAPGAASQTPAKRTNPSASTSGCRRRGAGGEAPDARARCASASTGGCYSAPDAASQTPAKRTNRASESTRRCRRSRGASGESTSSRAESASAGGCRSTRGEAPGIGTHSTTASPCGCCRAVEGSGGHCSGKRYTQAGVEIRSAGA